MIAIKAVNLTKRYKDTIAVDSLNLSIEQGELFSLLGVNGAGKSTTIKMLSGLVEPTEGDAFLLGRSVVKEKEKVKEIINVSPQETAIAQNLSVKENLRFIAEIYGADKKEANLKVDKIIEEFDMEEIKNKKAKALSGGWQRRLSIAMALISEPQILFLDEPTLGLDVIARREVWSFIRKLKGKATIILTTHYLEEAEALSDHIGIMIKGKVKALGTLEELENETSTNNLEDAFVKYAEGGVK